MTKKEFIEKLEAELKDENTEVLPASRGTGAKAAGQY